ncbi:hypothetical protein BSKO_00259 [Bryopsis sp. KO-2023]|nr:hypothetical protein BSKO_00259 [Bryopsis sp. KO-2023]
MALFPALVVGFVAAYIAFLFAKWYKRNLLEREGEAEKSSETVRRKETVTLEGVNRVRILFGSQTGTAEKFGKQLKAKLLETYGTSVVAEVADLETYAYSHKLEKEEYVFFLVATYGDGDPTDSAIEFDEWLAGAAESGEQVLEGVKYSVFALGNTEYEHFCSFGKKVERLVGQLGAEKISKRVDGDDSQCIEDEFDSWMAELLQQLDKQDGFAERITATGSTILTRENVPAYDIMYEAPSTTEKEVSASARVRSSGGSMGHSIKMACITEIRELHSSKSDRSCIHVELDLSMSGITYQCGDHVAVLPENSLEVVEEAASCLGESLDTKFTLSLPAGNPKNLERPFPGPITLKSALTMFADLTSAPQKSALPALAAFASDNDEADKLRFLASSEGKEEYMQWVHNNHMSLLELMEAFPSVRPSLGAFFGTICPRLQPRYYSISSSPKLFPTRIHVTAAVVNERKPSGRIHKGVCTNWLRAQQVNSFAPIHVRRSHFKLPADPSVPIIMVGPGTGLAPFRGFLQERAKLLESGRKLGQALLFFGCRHRMKDFIYEEELMHFKEVGAISELHTAFSRDGTKKDYVTHHLKANKEEVFSLLFGNNKGHLYVCGEAARMAKDVHRTLHEIVVEVKGTSQSEAESFVKALNDQGRYQKDVW